MLFPYVMIVEVEGDKYCKELKYDEAAKSYRKATDLGCAVAMASLGDLYSYCHDGIKQDVKEMERPRAPLGIYGYICAIGHYK
jgi:TPR repeat protein